MTTVVELGEWKRKSVLVDADSVCKTSSESVVTFDINFYCIEIGHFKFASNIGLVTGSGVKAF
jgi:hypothetical protein